MKGKQKLVRQASQKFNNPKFKVNFRKCYLGIIYHQNNANYQNDKSKKLLHRDNLGRNQKRETKQSKVMAGGISQPLRNCSLFFASTVLPSGYATLSFN